MVARKYFFYFKGSNEQKPWIKGSGICTGKSNVENKRLELYYSNGSERYS